MLRKFRAYRTSGDALTVLVKKNIVQSLFIKGASVIINLALVPLTLGLLSKELYGVWLTLSSIVTWFLFIDFGLGNGLRNKLTELLVRNERAQARVYVSTLYVTTGLISLGFLLLYALVHPYLNWASVLRVPARWQGEVSLLADAAFSTFGLQLILRNISFVLLAVHKSAVNGLFSLLSNGITLGLLLLFQSYLAGSILKVGLALLIPQGLVLIGFHLYFFGSELRYLRPSWKLSQFITLRHFGSLGLAFFVVQVAWAVIFTTTNLLITRLLGPIYVTEYDIAYKYFGLLPMVFGLLLTPLWSAFGEAYHRDDADWIRKTLRRMRLIWVLMTAGQVVLVAAASVVIPLWVGGAVTVSRPLAFTMMIYYSLYTYGGLYVNLLNGIGQVKNQVWTSVVASLLLVPLTYGLVSVAHLGLVGVLIAVMVCSAYSVVIAPLEVKRLLKRMATKSSKAEPVAQPQAL